MAEATLERHPDPYARRFGPSVHIDYSCRGCVYHRYEDGHCGRRYLCAEGSIVERYGEMQYTSTTKAMAPDWCPYRAP